jgi:hypothetical protein
VKSDRGPPSYFVPHIGIRKYLTDSALGIFSVGRAPRAAAGCPGEVALEEILALRSLLLNLHFRAAKAEPMAEVYMRGSL